MIDEARATHTNPQRRLPDLALPSVGESATVPLNPPGRSAPVIVLTHAGRCEACEAYLQRLGAKVNELQHWDGRVLVVRSGPSEGVEEETSGPFPTLRDADGRLETTLEVKAPAVAVADQWGEIHALEPAGEDHRFLSPEEVVEWARYLAIQCPECQGEAF